MIWLPMKVYLKVDQWPSPLVTMPLLLLMLPLFLPSISQVALFRASKISLTDGSYSTLDLGRKVLFLDREDRLYLRTLPVFNFYLPRQRSR